MNDIRAILFDLDGTLIDSLPDIAAALNRALEEFKLSRADTRDVRRWIGDGIVTLCERALAQQHAVERLVAFVPRMRMAYEANAASETTCFPNIMQILDLLQVENIKSAVLTNKPHALTLQILDAMGLTSRFQCVKGYRNESDKKPSPTQALSIARELAIAPAQCVVVGDSPIDIETARRAGMHSIGVTWGYRDRSELDAAKPDAIIDDPLKIFSLLGLGKKNF
ncbi:MAG: HAD-IA family hydrolase [Planctomycetes bacterium]|nr:HAD-IA family hydrolase [Planctomycetota bacterium]